MEHPIHRVRTVEVVEGYSIRVSFDDETTQTIDLEPLLVGELYGPLRDPKLFRQVTVDPEVATVVWPNGADFDPATLHDWPRHREAMYKMAERWVVAEAS